jgi:hypothetical protein
LTVRWRSESLEAAQVRGFEIEQNLAADGFMRCPKRTAIRLPSETMRSSEGAVDRVFGGAQPSLSDLPGTDVVLLELDQRLDGDQSENVYRSAAGRRLFLPALQLPL